MEGFEIKVQRGRWQIELEHVDWWVVRDERGDRSLLKKMVVRIWRMEIVVEGLVVGGMGVALAQRRRELGGKGGGCAD